MANNNIKAAVVNVFVRDVSNRIIIENGIPQIHSTVLYKQEGKYLVIDPNNMSFSAILAGADDNIRICFNKKFQIYNAEGPRGPAADQWRDCIDVAVKLAFNLIVNAKLGFDEIKVDEIGDNIGFIDVQSFKKSASIKEITNQVNIHNHIHVVAETLPIRMKQSSNVLESKKATGLLVILESISSMMKENLKEKGLIHSFNAFSIQEESILENLFSTKQGYEECLKDSFNIIREGLDPKLSTLAEPYISLLEHEISQIGDLNII